MAAAGDLAAAEQHGPPSGAVSGRRTSSTDQVVFLQGIDVIPLKGVFLSHQLYSDMGMRSSVDVDILVKPEHIDCAEHIAIATGLS